MILFIEIHSVASSLFIGAMSLVVNRIQHDERIRNIECDISFIILFSKYSLELKKWNSFFYAASIHYSPLGTAEQAQNRRSTFHCSVTLSVGTNMATLLPSLSSDEEDNLEMQRNADEESLGDEVNEEFEFGGVLVRRQILSRLVLFCVFFLCWYY